MNNSSLKTRKLIKDTFIVMLSEKKEIAKITVSGLVQRAGLSRATFYSHFDDIYGVIEDFEEELIDNFFTNARLLATDDCEKFFDEMFSFMEQNGDNYKMMCKSDEFLFSAKRLILIANNKLLELVNNDPKIKRRDFVELDVSVFLEGVVCEYIKYCRGLTKVTPELLKSYSVNWYRKFLKDRC